MRMFRGAAAAIAVVGSVAVGGCSSVGESPSTEVVGQTHQAYTQTSAPWHLDRIDQADLPLDGTYSFSTCNGYGVTVYIVGSGLDPTHGQYALRATNINGLWPGAGGPNNYCGTTGTNAAGVVGSTTYGVAKGVTLRGVKVNTCNGTTNPSSLGLALDWIVNNATGGKSVVLLALPNSEWMDNVTARTYVRNTVEDLIAENIPVVIGVDPDHSPQVDFPSGVLWVAATYSDDTVLEPGGANMLAPGMDIQTTAPGNTIATVSGANLAAAAVAGAAAMYLSCAPAPSPTSDPTTPQEVFTKLASEGSDVGWPWPLLRVPTSYP